MVHIGLLYQLLVISDNYVLNLALDNSGSLKHNETTVATFENSYDKGYADGVSASAAESGVEIRKHTHSESAGCYRYTFRDSCSNCGNAAFHSNTTNYHAPHVCGACGKWACSTSLSSTDVVCGYSADEVVYLKVGSTVYVNK